MKTQIGCWIAVLVLFCLPGCQSGDETDAGRESQDLSSTDYEDITTAARRVVEAWSSKDFDALFEMTPVEIPEDVREEFKPGGQRYEAMTSEDDYAWRAVRDWDGTFPEVRMQRRLGIIIGEHEVDTGSDMKQNPDSEERFGEIVTEYSVVNMIWENGQWKYHGMFHWDEEQLGLSEHSNQGIIPAGKSEPTGSQDFGNGLNLLHAVITAFQDKDLESLKELVTQERLAEYEAQVERASSNDYKGASEDDFGKDEPSGSTETSAPPELSIEQHLKMISSWSEDAFQELIDWDGQVLDSRMLEETWVKIGAEGEETYVVELSKLDGKWMFSDVLSPDNDYFSEWGFVLKAK
ncbi:MAG: hypothetical protein ACR2NP_21685 [Pirellulaceae bacterium]